MFLASCGYSAQPAICYLFAIPVLYFKLHWFPIRSIPARVGSTAGPFAIFCFLAYPVLFRVCFEARHAYSLSLRAWFLFLVRSHFRAPTTAHRFALSSKYSPILRFNGTGFYLYSSVSSTRALPWTTSVSTDNLHDRTFASRYLFGSSRTPFGFWPSQYWVSLFRKTTSVFTNKSHDRLSLHVSSNSFWFLRFTILGFSFFHQIFLIFLFSLRFIIHFLFWT